MPYHPTRIGFLMADIQADVSIGELSIHGGREKKADDMTGDWSVKQRENYTHAMHFC